MNAQDFAYWFKGWIEIENPEEISKEQLQIIKDHLDLVFTKVTPDYTKPLDWGSPQVPYVPSNPYLWEITCQDNNTQTFC